MSHFFDRFFDTEELSPGAEPQANTVQILGFVAVPSGLFTILCLPMVLTGWTLVAVRNFFVSFSMIVTAMVIVFEWDALFPDRRDYQILTPLPLRLWTFFLAKALALGLLVGVFLVDANFFGLLLWPSADGSGGGYFELICAHVVAIFAAGVWAALAAASLRGVLVTVFSGAWLRRVSVAVQTLLMAVLVTLLVVGPWIGPPATRRLSDSAASPSGRSWRPLRYSSSRFCRSTAGTPARRWNRPRPAPPAPAG